MLIEFFYLWSTTCLSSSLLLTTVSPLAAPTVSFLRSAKSKNAKRGELKWFHSPGRAWLYHRHKVPLGPVNKSEYKSTHLDFVRFHWALVNLHTIECSEIYANQVHPSLFQVHWNQYKFMEIKFLWFCFTMIQFSISIYCNYFYNTTTYKHKPISGVLLIHVPRSIVWATKTKN